MQYSEYVEVIDPLDVRNMVIDNIKKICKKYEKDMECQFLINHLNKND